MTSTALFVLVNIYIIPKNHSCSVQRTVAIFAVMATRKHRQGRTMDLLNSMP